MGVPSAKLELENILSENTSEKYVVFLDMDGVLVDMTKDTVEVINKNLSAYWKGVPLDEIHPKSEKNVYKRRAELKKLATLMKADRQKKVTYKQFEHLTYLKDSGQLRREVDQQVGNYFYVMALGNWDFWVNMKSLAYADELVALADTVSADTGGVRILSAPLDQIVVDAKREWVAKNLPTVSPENVFIEKDKGKFLMEYEIPQGATAILIDDREKYRKSFEAAGGKTISYNPMKAKSSFKKAKLVLEAIINR